MKKKCIIIEGTKDLAKGIIAIIVTMGIVVILGYWCTEITGFMSPTLLDYVFHGVMAIMMLVVAVLLVLLCIAIVQTYIEYLKEKCKG